jgi:hypothetical protein
LGIFDGEAESACLQSAIEPSRRCHLVITGQGVVEERDRGTF